mgnify:CR=1 FL=1|jgi:hypothetical protein
MIINLFNTNVEELNTKLANTIWQVSDVQLTVKNIYVDGWTGGYCARFIDGSWGRVASLLEKGQQVN